MSLYNALAQYRNEWVALHTGFGWVYHGIIQEVSPNHVKIREFRDENINTVYIRTEDINQFSPDVAAMQRTRAQASWDAEPPEEGTLIKA